MSLHPWQNDTRHSGSGDVMATQADALFRHLAALIGGSYMLAGPAFAEDPLACLDPAVADTLLAKPNEGPHAVMRTLPDDFPIIEFPREFELIGSRTLLQRSIVAFKTSLSKSQALARLEAIGYGQGWQRFHESSMSGQGFQRPAGESDTASVEMCKPAERRVSVQVFPAANGNTYVTLTAATLQFGEGCEVMGMVPQGHHQLPILYLPEGESGAAYGAFAESEEETVSMAQLDSHQSAAQVMEYFAEQLSAQAWRRVSVWAQDALEGSAWVSRDERTYGLLTVIEDGPESYELRFDALGGQ